MKTTTTTETEDKTKAITELRMCFQAVCALHGQLAASARGAHQDACLKVECGLINQISDAASKILELPDGAFTLTTK